jgi:hypothetical protein
MRHVGRVMVVTTMALAAVWPAAAQAAKWSLQSAAIPAGASASPLYGVSCTTATACMAVGGYTSSGDTYPYADEYASGKWTVRSMVNPTGETDTIAFGVSCTSSSACTAVGREEGTTSGEFAERWNGTSWALQSPVNRSGGSLNSVSCAKSTECVAVGDYVEGTTVVPLAERWNGTSWAQQTTPDPKGSGWTELRSVSCTSSTACTAVGFTETSGTQKPFAERWNGTEWSVLSTITPTGTLFAELAGVSCYAASECVAVGWYETSTSSAKTVIESLGPVFTVQQNSANSNKAYTRLEGVSCPSGECLPVGAAGPEEPYSEHWIGLEGEEWASIATPSEPSSERDELRSVSCPAVAECVAVGGYNLSGTAKPLAEGYA